MSTEGLRFVLGGSYIYTWTEEDTRQYLEAMKRWNVVDIDTSIIYGNGEEIIGAFPEKDSLRIHTKTLGFMPGALSEENVLTAAKTSLQNLGQIDTYFFQSPDPTTPWEDSLAALATVYAEGTFRAFGLSNFSAEQVQEVYDHCKAKGYVLPTVFSGSYNAIQRKDEDELFPTLRRLGISYWAYSPIGAGFLTKRVEDFNLPGNEGYGPGRFSRQTGWGGHINNTIYNHPKLLEALKLWNDIVDEAKLPPAELAARWISNHSLLDVKFGDAVIVGCSKPAQLEMTLENAKKGPLSNDLVLAIDKVWELAKQDDLAG